MFKKNWFRVLVTITVGLFILTLIYSEFENLVAEKKQKKFELHIINILNKAKIKKPNSVFITSINDFNVDRICFQLAYTFKEDFEKQIGYDVYKYGLIYESVVRWWLIDKKQQVIFADIPILAVMGPAENSMTCSAHGISYVNFSWSNSSGKYFIKD